MGNWLGKKQAVVHPLSQYLNKSGVENLKGITRGANRSGAAGGIVRVQVRMRARELKELMAQVDPSPCSMKGDIKTTSAELGRLILQESLKGRWVARVVDIHGGRQDMVTEYISNKLGKVSDGYVI